MKKKLIYMIGMMISLFLLFGCETSNANIPDVEITNVDISSPTEENVSNQETSDLKDETEGNESAEKNAESVDGESEVKKPELEDGEYLAEFNTDSSMFHVNEMCDGKGTLTVSDGKMVIHISLPSKSILNLYYGLADDAKKDGAVLLEPTVDTIDYNDGTAEDVHGFDIPVPYLDDEFDVALIGTKGKWYDHKVSVSNPVLKEQESEENNADTNESEIRGDYSIELELEGGTGKATVSSPAQVLESDEGYILIIEWSSPNYDYMIVNDIKYLPVNTEGNSVFEIPVKSFDEDLEVTADTVAMSKPHEIEYIIRFNKDSLKEIK